MSTPTEGEIVPPITDYEPEVIDPEPQPEPTSPPTDDGSPIPEPTYPAPWADAD
jgi:hypothetical protein